MSLEDLRARARSRRTELACHRVIVLAGGSSAERDVSLNSGRSIAAALQQAGYSSTLAEIPAGPPMVWLQEGSSNAIGARSAAPPGKESPGTESTGFLATVAAEAASVMPPIVFSALHGTMGEDGAWQGLLELFGLPYASAGVKGSAVGMDKVLTKRIAQQLGLQTPRWWVMNGGETAPAIARAIPELVAKPVAEGSSVGVTMLERGKEFEARLLELTTAHSPLLIEERIYGRELTLGMIGPTGEPCALPMIEIVPKQGFYDYDNKYTAGATEYLCPAIVEPDVAQQLATHSTLLYRELDLGPMARFDFILDEAGTAWFLEVNTLPGFTNTSLLPKAAAAAGVEYGELLEILLLCALERWEQKQGGAR